MCRERMAARGPCGVSKLRQTYMPPIASNKQEERVHEERIRTQPPEEEKQIKPLTVRQYKHERESLKHRRERGTTLHKQTGPVMSGRQQRRRPKHGENKWWRDQGLSPRSSSTYSESIATSSENGSSKWPSSQPSTPWYSTPTPYKGHIPKIMITDAEPSPVALDRNPCMLSNKDYKKHKHAHPNSMHTHPNSMPTLSNSMPTLSNSMPTLSNSMPTLSNSMPTLFMADKKQQQRRVHSPKSPLRQPSSHSSDNLVKLPELPNCQMTRLSSCDLPSNKRLPKLLI